MRERLQRTQLCNERIKFLCVGPEPFRMRKRNVFLECGLTDIVLDGGIVSGGTRLESKIRMSEDVSAVDMCEP